jgi:hypothetical protein
MQEPMRLGSHVLAAILGGPGIFYLWESFYVPPLALKAFLFLAAALTINLLLYPEVVGADSSFATVQRVLARMTRRPPRR